MIPFFKQAPFLRFIIPFIAGIIVCTLVPVPFSFIIVFGAISVVLFVLFYFHPRISGSYKYSWLFGSVVFCFFFFFGIFIAWLKTFTNDAYHFRNSLAAGPQFAWIKIYNDPEKAASTIKTIVSVEAIKYGNEWRLCRGKAMVYFNADSSAGSIGYGDKVFIKARFKETQSPKNPFEFDYKKYLGHNGIGYTAFVSSSQFAVKNTDEGNLLYQTAYECRKYLLNIFVQNNIEGQELAVASALILGYDNNIEKEVMDDYSASGTLHVLSVSGLHVGILFIFFSYITGKIKRLKYGGIIRAVSLLLIIWSYALVTGLAPAVQRSAVMFSFLVLAEVFKKQANIYNTIAASAFLLLVIDPYLLFDIGFQLSYLAVAGIVYIYPRIFSLWEPGNKIYRFTWSLICVSIAAQLITFPLGLYYFHQFPNYFLLSNIVVIPLATIVLYTGVLLLCVSKVVFLSLIVGDVLNFFLRLLNGSVKLFGEIPFSTFNNIVISGFDLCLIYTLVFIILLYFSLPRVRFIYSFLFVVILLLVSRLVQQHNNLIQQKFIVYNTPYATSIDFITGKECIFISDSVLSGKNDRYISPNRIMNGIKKVQNIGSRIDQFEEPDMLFIKDNFIMFGGKKIYLMNKKQIDNKDRMKVDYIVISGNPYIDIKRLKNKFVFDKIIIDSSNYRKNIAAWKKLFEQNNISYHSVPDSGAFIIEG